jgi:hypothetical protein
MPPESSIIVNHLISSGMGKGGKLIMIHGSWTEDDRRGFPSHGSRITAHRLSSRREGKGRKETRMNDDDSRRLHNGSWIIIFLPQEWETI